MTRESYKRAVGIGLHEDLAASLAGAARGVLGSRNLRIGATGALVEAFEARPGFMDGYASGAFTDEATLVLEVESAVFRAAYSAPPGEYIQMDAEWPATDATALLIVDRAAAQVQDRAGADLQTRGDAAGTSDNWRVSEIHPGAAFTRIEFVSLEEAG